MAGDPLLPNDWRADPWDDVSVVPETATEELRPGFDYLRGPVRMVVTMVVATVLLLGAAGWWTIHQLNPSGDPGAPVNFTINDGDTEFEMTFSGYGDSGSIEDGNFTRSIENIKFIISYLSYSIDCFE